jgi:uncharacterized protein (TIGR02145 family)
MKKRIITALLVTPMLLFSYGNIHTVLSSTIDKSKATGEIKTVKIGKQEWMATNLDVSNFKNGQPIPEAKSNDDWLNAYSNEQPAWSYYDRDPENGKKYGKLYNWYAVKDPRGLAPAGWHVPTDAEWVQLTTYLGGNNVAGTKLKSATGWNAGGSGTNESAFDGLPGGARNFDGNFFYVGDAGYWWSATELSANHALPMFLNFINGTVERSSTIYYSKGLGMSVRLLKD